jgi:cephalosporin hydroxylase
VEFGVGGVLLAVPRSLLTTISAQLGTSRRMFRESRLARLTSTSIVEETVVYSPARIVTDFHDLYYSSAVRTWQQTFWMGVPLAKCPLDLWVYQEIVFEVQPELIVECGTFRGGSAYFFASLCDLIGRGNVITIDVAGLPNRPQHPRITYLTGSSTSRDVVDEVHELGRRHAPVMVVLDSDHHEDHVFEELTLYAPLVTPGSYLIVEDTNINGHPVATGFGPGPMEAVNRFVRQHPEFSPDRDREKFFMTFNPSGYLKKH